MPEIQTIKISELPETSNLNGLRTLGTTADNQSVAAQLQAVADATANANDAATQAQEAAQTANEAAQTANAAASAANQATDNVIDAINKTEAAYTNATAAAESANEAAAAANSAADQAIGFINSAQTAVDNANTAANAANEAATTATNAANNANTQAEYAKEQGDYAKQQGDAVLAQKGQPNGLAELDSTGRVPASQLPSYVDDVIDVDTYNDLPNPGESGKIYITTDTNLQYRWSGTGYAEISPSLALGTTSETAGRGDWTQAAYNHSLITNGSNPHKTTFASLPDAPTSLPANGGNAESAVKDGDGNNISTSYFNINRGTVTDLNDADDIGMWSFTTGAQNVPEEITTSGIVFTYYSTAAIANLIQMCTGYKNGVPTSWYVRNRTSYTAWSPWRKIWDSGNLTKLSQLQDDVVSGNYFKLSANRVTDLNDAPINSFFVSSNNPANSPASYTTYAVGLTLALNNDKNFKQQLIYTADNWYYRSQGGGDWYQWHVLWSAANFNPSDKLGVNAAAAAIKDTSDNSSKKIWTGTQAEYDAISTKDSNTIYFIM